MDVKQQACAHSSLSLACYFSPFIKALYFEKCMKYFLAIVLVTSFQSLACVPPVFYGSDAIINVPDPEFKAGTVENVTIGKVSAKVSFDKSGRVIKVDILKLVPASLPAAPIKEALNSARLEFLPNMGVVYETENEVPKAVFDHQVDIEFPIKFKEKLNLQLHLNKI